MPSSRRVQQNCINQGIIGGQFQGTSATTLQYYESIISNQKKSYVKSQPPHIRNDQTVLQLSLLQRSAANFCLALL